MNPSAPSGNVSLRTVSCTPIIPLHGIEYNTNRLQLTDPSTNTSTRNAPKLPRTTTIPSPRPPPTPPAAGRALCGMRRRCRIPHRGRRRRAWVLRGWVRLVNMDRCLGRKDLQGTGRGRGLVQGTGRIDLLLGWRAIYRIFVMRLITSRARMTMTTMMLMRSDGRRAFQLGLYGMRDGVVLLVRLDRLGHRCHRLSSSSEKHHRPDPFKARRVS